MSISKCQQSGSALILVVFILVILSLGAAVAGSLVMRSAQNNAGSYQQAQAMALSRSAMDVALQAIIKEGGCPLGSAVVFPDFDEYTVSMTCTQGKQPKPEAVDAACQNPIGVDACFYHVIVSSYARSTGIKKTLQAELKSDAIVIPAATP